MLCPLHRLLILQQWLLQGYRVQGSQAYSDPLSPSFVRDDRSITIRKQTLRRAASKHTRLRHCWPQMQRLSYRQASNGLAEAGKLLAKAPLRQKPERRRDGQLSVLRTTSPAAYACSQPPIFPFLSKQSNSIAPASRASFGNGDRLQ